MDLLAQPPLRSDAEAIAHHQHPDQQFGIDRGTPHRAVERRQVSTQPFQLNEPVDRPQQVVRRDVVLQREGGEQGRLISPPLTHHRAASGLNDQSESAASARGNSRLFQQYRPTACVIGRGGDRLLMRCTTLRFRLGPAALAAYVLAVFDA